ncbi:hypothetical protein niasHS_009574 [Heterodera schachtii]|uniref:Nodule Cysteine-Rich (NCR) secreted peptide n=1 Tax=Heterodera schachtii TaxID=97005 RepID=A0ABD2JB58_HETSC
MTPPSFYGCANNKNPRKEGKFESENRCSCPEAELYAVECKKVVCNKMNRRNLLKEKCWMAIGFIVRGFYPQICCCW